MGGGLGERLRRPGLQPGLAIATPGVKESLWVNGFLLGRYGKAGPQTELYLPWPLLRLGRNEIVVLEVEGDRSPRCR